jgi:hypothetical protein
MPLPIGLPKAMVLRANELSLLTVLEWRVLGYKGFAPRSFPCGPHSFAPGCALLGQHTRELPLAFTMDSVNRIAGRYQFETRILIRYRRDVRNLTAQGWARDLSESGMGAFVAEPFAVGQAVVLIFTLPEFGKVEIPARVARRLGTQFGFQFLSLSAGQRAAIQATLAGQPAIPYVSGSSRLA